MNIVVPQWHSGMSADVQHDKQGIDNSDGLSVGSPLCKCVLNKNNRGIKNTLKSPIVADGYVCGLITLETEFLYWWWADHR